MGKRSNRCPYPDIVNIKAKQVKNIESERECLYQELGKLQIESDWMKKTPTTLTYDTRLIRNVLSRKRLKINKRKRNEFAMLLPIC